MLWNIIILSDLAYSGWHSYKVLVLRNCCCKIWYALFWSEILFHRKGQFLELLLILNSWEPNKVDSKKVPMHFQWNVCSTQRMALGCRDLKWNVTFSTKGTYVGVQSTCPSDEFFLFVILISLSQALWKYLSDLRLRNISKDFNV